MHKLNLKRYWFLALTVLSLALGLTLSNSEVISNVILSTGAAVGLVLSVRWTIASIRNREVSSDSLALIAIVAALLVSEFLAAAIVSLMLATGRALEDWAKGKSQSELKALLERAPKIAHLLLDNAQVKDVDLADIKIGDRIRVLGGEVVPIDGVLLSNAELDESALTGEPMPVNRLLGEQVSSGVVNSAASFELKVSCLPNDSTYASLIRLVEQATASSAKSVRLANRWALWFVPFTLILSTVSLVLSGDVLVAVAVLIAATPCPLILAIPVAIISGMSKAASRGALIKTGDALEHLAKAKIVMLDKTGTLTRGGPAVTEAVFAEGVSAEEVVQLAASLELHSPHVVAKAIVTEAERMNLELLPASDVSESHGRQIAGTVDGKRVEVGQPPANLPSWAKVTSTLRVAVSVDGKLVSLLGLDDPIREDSLHTVEAMRRLGIERVILVSGDVQKTADEIGKQINANEVIAECSPEQKLELVRREMKQDSKSVILVGDGINDAPALAAASVGVAMGARGATAASEAADVVIIEDSISHLAYAIDISQGAYTKAKQAGLIGMSLSIAAMLSAAFGLLNPTQAAITQEVIDAAAILWALTPLTSKLKRNWPKPKPGPIL